MKPQDFTMISMEFKLSERLSKSYLSARQSIISRISDKIWPGFSLLKCILNTTQFFGIMQMVEIIENLKNPGSWHYACITGSQ